MFLSNTGCRKGGSRFSLLSLCGLAIVALLMGLTLPRALADSKKKGDDKKDHAKADSNKKGDGKKDHAEADSHQKGDGKKDHAKAGSHAGKGKSATHVGGKGHKSGKHPGKAVGKVHIKRVGVKRHVVSIHITKHYRVLHLGRLHRPRWAPRVVGVVVRVAPRPYRVRVIP
jgi:hypothetical protein